jgi:hypothetical protein
MSKMTSKTKRSMLRTNKKAVAAESPVDAKTAEEALKSLAEKKLAAVDELFDIIARLKKIMLALREKRPRSISTPISDMTTEGDKAIWEYLEIVHKLEELVKPLCQPCPACRANWPLAPGEIINEKNKIDGCKRCLGRGYLVPKKHRWTASL